MLPYFGVLLVTCALAVAGMAESRGFARGPLTEGPTREATNQPTVSHRGLAYFSILALAVLALFSGLRWQVGTDFDLYSSLYRHLEPRYVGYELSSSPQELGFTILQLLLRTRWESAQILIGLTAVVTVAASGAALNRLSYNFAASLALYVLLGFYLAPFNIIRQGLAMALNFLAYSYYERNRRAWLVLNILASSLHLSALLAASLQWVARHIRVSAWRALAVVGVASVAALLFSKVQVYLAPLGLVNARYEEYLTGQQSGIGTYLYLSSRALLVLIAFWLWRGDRDSSTGLNSTVFGLVFLLLGTQAVAVGRLELYFSIFLTIDLVNGVMRKENKSVRVPISFVIAVISIAFFAAYLVNFADLVPYRSLIDP